ncbi:MAG: flagellar export protein FliJ [Lachnospiraceae bacterium]|nr:flagellar export protein FliJ [Lachnospiraceae bacterium]
MAKFVYKMENILSIKYKMEEQAKGEFAAAQAALNAEEDKLEALEQKKLYYEKTLAKLLLDRLALLDIKSTEEAIEVMKYHIEEQKRVIRKCEEQLEIARNVLNEAMIERKTHEKLKEKAFEEFKKEVEKEERRDVDELVSYRFRP